MSYITLLAALRVGLDPRQPAYPGKVVTRKGNAASATNRVVEQALLVPNAGGLFMARTDLPLSILIRKRSQELSLSRSELVTACGYKNISKGLRRLDQVYAGDFDRAGALLRKLPDGIGSSA